MATANVQNTNIVFPATQNFPYYDDFDESKNFHKILFRPGYAVQARELTQLQTIIQNQVERFGAHIFQNGSLVHGGQISLDRKRGTHINLQSTYAGEDVDPQDFVGKVITWSSNTRARAYVMAAQDATANTPPTLAIKYLSGRKFGHGDTIRISDADTYANLATSNSNGRCVLASISDGIFFINGYFVKTPDQTVIASAYNRRANCKIGLEYTPSIIDEDSDSSLLDPAQESSNYQAPGAARLAIDLVLSTRDLEDDSDESQFIELMRIEDGTIQKWVKYPFYSDLADTLARRTEDESGSYTVRPFQLSFKNHPTDDTKVIALLSPGKAYVEGYERETIAETEIEMSRARTTDSVANYDLSTAYGNWFVGQNLTGIFDTTTWAMADIHSVPYVNIDRNAATAYASTHMGTTRVRAMRYYASANALAANDRTYTISITGTKFNKIQTNVVSGSGKTVTLFNPTNLLSNVANAYQGATLRLGATTSSRGRVYRIRSSGGATMNLSRRLVDAVTASSNAIIGFDMRAAESLTISAFTSGSPSDRANVNFSEVSKSPVANTGDAYLNDTDTDTLLFRFPKSYIASGSITDQSLSYVKKFTPTFAGLTTTIGLDATKESFVGSGSSATSSTLLDNFLVIDAAGNVQRLESVSVDGTETATLVSESYNGAATVFARVNLNAGNNTKPKRKTEVTGNTSHFVRHAANGSFLAGSSNTTVYLVAGQVSIENPSRVHNEPMSLYVSDVKRITAIYDLNGGSIPAVGASINSNSEVKSKYNFDNGQNDSFYDHASISLSPSADKAPKGPLIVCFNYYDHGTGETDDGAGYFSVDSYPNANTTAGYAAIPRYTRTSGEVVELRDAIDFRPRRTNASNADPSFSFSAIRIPAQDDEFTSDYQYFLARRDLIVIKPRSQQPFDVIQGIAATYPIEPQRPARGMVLHKVLMPAFTESTNDIMVQFVENKRYTMRDIGVLEQRIENMEYYVTLSRLEAAAKDQVILDKFGLERTKYGIIVDDFKGHAVGDVINPDYKCAVDKVEGAMGPALRRKRFEMEVDDSSLSGTINTRRTVLLDYTERVVTSNPSATRVENVQPFLFADFVGEIFLSPAVSSFVTTNIAPIVLI
jgi:uncharacterized protein YbcI